LAPPLSNISKIFFDWGMVDNTRGVFAMYGKVKKIPYLWYSFFLNYVARDYKIKNRIAIKNIARRHFNLYSSFMLVYKRMIDMLNSKKMRRTKQHFRNSSCLLYVMDKKIKNNTLSSLFHYKRIMMN